MTFYVKRARDSEIEGPFTLEEINQMVRQKRFRSKSLAISDIGQSLQAVRSAPAKEWIKLVDIPGFEPDPDEERNCLCVALVVLAVIGLIAVIGLLRLIDILNRIE